MSNRLLLYSVIGFMVVVSVFVASLGTLRGVMAQDGTSVTSTPAGKLFVVPQDIDVGQTAYAIGLHVVPYEQEVELRYTGHFALAGESCASAGAGTTATGTAPVSVDLVACSAGNAYVRLVAADSGLVIEEVDVIITKPGAVRRQNTESVSLSGVESSLVVWDSDRFSVTASGMDDSGSEYTLTVLGVNSGFVAFNADCDEFEVEYSIGGVSSTTKSPTMWACDTPGTNLRAFLELDGRDVAMSDRRGERVDVDAAEVEFGSSSYSVDEGEEVTIRVELSNEPSTTVRIPIDVEGGHTVTGLDSGDLVFSRGDDRESFTIEADEDRDCDDERDDIEFGSRLPTGVEEGSTDSAVLEVDDDDRGCNGVTPTKPTASFTSPLSPHDMDEDDGPVTVRVTLSRAAGRSFDLPITFQRGSGAYSTSLGSSSVLSFTSTQTMKDFTFDPVEDDNDCDDEEVTIGYSISSSLPVAAGPMASQTRIINIDDNEDESDCKPTARFTAPSLSPHEMNEDDGSVSVTVTLSSAAGQGFDLPITFSGGSGAYSASLGSNNVLSFTSTQTSRSFTFDPIEDDSDCDDETVTIGYSISSSLPVVAGPLASRTRIINIDDNEDPSDCEVPPTKPTARFTVPTFPSPYPMTEGHSVTVKVRLSEAVGRVFYIPITFSGDSDAYSFTGLDTTTFADLNRLRFESTATEAEFTFNRC